MSKTNQQDQIKRAQEILDDHARHAAVVAAFAMQRCRQELKEAGIEFHPLKMAQAYMNSFMQRLGVLEFRGSNHVIDGADLVTVVSVEDAEIPK